VTRALRLKDAQHTISRIRLLPGLTDFANPDAPLNIKRWGDFINAFEKKSQEAVNRVTRALDPTHLKVKAMLGWLTNEGKQGSLLTYLPERLGLSTTNVKDKLKVFHSDARALRSEKARKAPQGASRVMQGPQQRPLREEELTLPKGVKRTLVIIDEPRQPRRAPEGGDELPAEQQAVAPEPMQVEPAEEQEQEEQ